MVTKQQFCFHLLRYKIIAGILSKLDSQREIVVTTYKIEPPITGYPASPQNNNFVPLHADGAPDV
jgi:hypothetical protein